jgi:hypothetical protein
MKERIYLNFENGMLTTGSFDDLKQLGLKPQVGMHLDFYDVGKDEHGAVTYQSAEGVLTFDQETGSWYATLDPGSIRPVASPDS